MRLLQKQFTSNFDKVGDCEFTQLEKHEGKDNNVYIYERKRDNKLFSYEVFISKRRLKGQPLPGGAFEAEDREQYPGAAQFGFTAKETRNFEQAKVFFREFIDKLDTKEENQDHPENKKKKTLVLPDGNFCIKDLVVLNPNISQPLIYVEIQKLIKLGTIEIKDRKKSVSGRGKPTVFYGKV